jgi:gamma-glutamylcysteine synthetase
MDAPHPSLLAPLITLFTSLMYDPTAREYILTKVPHYLPVERSNLFKEIALKGMYAKLNNQILLDIIVQLLEQGRKALTRRITAGIESQSLLTQFENFVGLVEQAKSHKSHLCRMPGDQGAQAQVHDVLEFCSL